MNGKAKRPIQPIEVTKPGDLKFGLKPMPIVRVVVRKPKDPTIEVSFWELLKLWVRLTFIQDIKDLQKGQSSNVLKLVPMAMRIGNKASLVAIGLLIVLTVVLAFLR